MLDKFPKIDEDEVSKKVKYLTKIYINYEMQKLPFLTRKFTMNFQNFLKYLEYFFESMSVREKKFMK